MTHRYLFTLEVAPVREGETYDALLSHLTLMSRFFSNLSPAQLAEVVRLLFQQTRPLELTFGEATKLGLKHLAVHLVKPSNELKHLHNALRTLLDSLHVNYEYPPFVGKGYKPHVTQRPGTHFYPGNKKVTHHACLIEISAGKRIIRSKFALADS